MSIYGGEANIVDDEEMSSQGSVHSPFAVTSEATHVQSPVIQQTVPSGGSPLRPQSPVSRAAPTMQSSIVGTPSAFASTIPITGGSEHIGTVSTTIPVGVPTLEETKAAFGEVSSAFQDISAKHGQIQGNLQTLASTVAALSQAKREEQEASSQVQETLKRTASVASELEMRLGEQSVIQEQSRITAERAQTLGEQAIRETRQLQIRHQSTAQELKQSMTAMESKLQEQTQQVSLREKSLQEAEEKARERLSQQLQAKTEIIQQQAGEATQVAVQAQAVAQNVTATITGYEAKMTEMSNTLAQLQNLIIEERKKRVDMEHQLSSAQDQIGAAERRSQVWATTNQQLESEVKSWMAAYNQ